MNRGDCIEIMAGLPGGIIDAIVCDPPCGFMGKEWDKLARSGPEVRLLFLAP